MSATKDMEKREHKLERAMCLLTEAHNNGLISCKDLNERIGTFLDEKGEQDHVLRYHS